MGSKQQEGILRKAIIFITVITMRVLRVALLLCAVVVLTEASKCPSGWSYYDERCFNFYASKENWGNAELRCQNLGGNLASVHSEAEYQFVRGVIKDRTHRDTKAWLGGSDASVEKIWLWSDGLPMKYTAWDRGQPDNSRRNQHCMVMNFSRRHRWDDQACSVRDGYVCAKDACMS